MKNYFSMMLIVLILFAIVLTSAFSAIGEQQGSQEITSGDYIYIVDKTIGENGGACIIKYIGESDVVNVPSRLDGYDVKKIDGAFKNNVLIKSIVLPESVVRVGAASFSGCTNLESFSGWVGEFMGYVSEKQFAGCGKLSEIHFPYEITTVENEAFFGCEKLTDFSSFVKSEYIGDRAFSGCGIEKVEINGPLFCSIGEEAFSNCSSIKSVQIALENGAIMEGLSLGSFQNCVNLEKIVVTGLVECFKVKGSAFSGCTKLNEIKLGENVFVSGPKALDNTAYFNNEENWKNGVLYLANCAVKGKDNLELCELEKDTKYIAGKAFSDCTALNKIILPESLKFVSSGAFENCNSLSSIIFDGSKNQYENIKIEEKNEPLQNGKVVYLKENEPVKTYSPGGDDWPPVTYDPEWYFGDVDRSYGFDMKDVLMIRKGLVTGKTTRVMDANEDGIVDLKDVLRLRRVICKLDHFPVHCYYE